MVDYNVSDENVDNIGLITVECHTFLTACDEPYDAPETEAIALALGWVAETVGMFLFSDFF